MQKITSDWAIFNVLGEIHVETIRSTSQEAVNAFMTDWPGSTWQQFKARTGTYCERIDINELNVIHKNASILRKELDKMYEKKKKEVEQKKQPKPPSMVQFALQIHALSPADQMVFAVKLAYLIGNDYFIPILSLGLDDIAQEIINDYVLELKAEDA